MLGRWLSDSVKKEKGSDFNLSLICESNRSVPPCALVQPVCQEPWSRAKLRPEQKKKAVSRLHSLLPLFLFSCCVSLPVCSSRYTLTSCKSKGLQAAALGSPWPGEYTLKFFSKSSHRIPNPRPSNYHHVSEIASLPK